MMKNTPFHTRIKNQVAVITLNKSDKSNLIDYAFLQKFTEKIATLGRDNRVRVILIRSSHKAFSVGVDWKKLYSMKMPKIKEFISLGNTLIDLLMKMDKITIAQIDGFAYEDGLGLALACDFRIASEPTLLGLPLISYGFVLVFDTIPLLMNLIGEKYANELIYTGSPIDSLRAEQIGLVTLAVQPENLDLETDKFVKKLLSVRNSGIQRYKSVLRTLEPIRKTAFEKVSYEILSKLLTNKRNLDKFKKYIESVNKS